MSWFKRLGLLHQLYIGPLHFRQRVWTVLFRNLRSRRSHALPAVRFDVFLPHCNGGFKVLWVCSCVRSCRVFWNPRLLSPWNGCMIVVMLCRHVRRYLRVCDVALQNALQWLHQGSLAAAACESWFVLEWLHRDCEGDLSADFFNFGADHVPLNFLCNSASDFFFALAPRSGFGPTHTAVVKKCNCWAWTANTAWKEVCKCKPEWR